MPPYRCHITANYLNKYYVYMLNIYTVDICVYCSSNSIYLKPDSLLGLILLGVFENENLLLAAESFNRRISVTNKCERQQETSRKSDTERPDAICQNRTRHEGPLSRLTCVNFQCSITLPPFTRLHSYKGSSPHRGNTPVARHRNDHPKLVGDASSSVPGGRNPEDKTRRFHYTTPLGARGRSPLARAGLSSF
jgi:hypothetical protein